MQPDTLAPASPAAVAARGPSAARYRRTWVVTRHTAVLLARDPGIVLTYAVMSAVLLIVLRPVYTRLAAAGTPSILQETPVLTGKALPLTGVFFIQQAVLFVFAAATFGLDLPAGSWRLPVMGLCWGLCVTTCGLALGVWVRTQGQLAAIADIVALLITCLSGCLVPLPILPRWVRAIAPYSPGYWASRGFQASVTADLRVYGQAIAVVLGVAAAGLAIAAIRAPRRR